MAVTSLVRIRLGLLTPLALLAMILVSAACTPSDPLEEIRSLQAQGNHAETLEPLRALLDEDPSSVEANFLFGRALLHGGEPGQAVWPLRKAKQSPEYAVEAGLLLTRATLRGRFKNEAIRAANDVLAIEPDNIAALEMRVEAHMGAADHASALIDIARVIELDPGNINIRAQEVLALIVLEQIEAASSALAATNELLEKDHGDVPEATRAKLCIVSGLFALERGELEQGQLEYAACLEKYPTDSLVVLESVTLHDKLGDPEKATSILQNALDQSPTSEFRLAMAERMQAMGNAEESVRLLRENAEQVNTSAAWFDLGSYHFHRDETNDALEAFERAIEASPNPPAMVRFAYADTLIVANRPDDARRAAASLDDESLKSLIEGRALLSEGDPEGALAAFDRGIKLWPNNPGARFLAGQAAEQVGDFERAESNYREAMRAEDKQPTKTEAALYLARLLEAKGAYVHALDRIGTYVRSHTDDPQGFIVTIRLANLLGRREIFNEGVQRLARLPGQAGVALALRVELGHSKSGSARIVEALEEADVDLGAEEYEPVLKLLAEKLAELGRHGEALGYISASIAKRPDASALHSLHGSALERASAPAAQVRAAHSKAIELGPEDPVALTGFARFEAAEGDTAAAIALYERADAADPPSADAGMAALALLGTSIPPAEAEARLVDLLRRYPHDPSVAGELAVRLAVGGKQMDRALALARRAGMFGMQPFDDARRALSAIEESGVQPQADAARTTLQELGTKADTKSEADASTAEAD